MLHISVLIALSESSTVRYLVDYVSKVFFDLVDSVLFSLATSSIRAHMSKSRPANESSMAPGMIFNYY